MKRFKITVDGAPYEVTVEEIDDTDVVPPTPDLSYTLASAATGHPPPPPMRTAAAVRTQPGDVASPLSGVITKIAVSVNATVKEGEALLHLEAMKMDSVVVAPLSGTVKSIAVSEGAAVQEGQVLLTIA